MVAEFASSPWAVDRPDVESLQRQAWLSSE
jgi:hypothetical protein